MSYTFDDKVRSMTFGAIVRAMIRGLQAEHVKRWMDSFGDYDPETQVCHGCAATNIICEISGKVFHDDRVRGTTRRAAFVDASPGFLVTFETAINYLRGQCMETYNGHARRLNIAQAPPDYVAGPALTCWEANTDVPTERLEPVFQAWLDSVKDLP